MKVLAQVLLWALFSAAVPSYADIIVLHDGTSYSGHYTPAGNGKLSFTDNQGIHYELPVADVQSLVFSNAADHLTLRNGKTYSGQLNGAEMIPFEGSGGIDYQFPFATSARWSLLDRRRPLRRGIFPRLLFLRGQTLLSAQMTLSDRGRTLRATSILQPSNGMFTAAPAA